MASSRTRYNTELVTGDVIGVGIKVIDPSLANSAGIFVGKGNLLRLRVAATAYISFMAKGGTFSAPTSSTDKTIELFTAGTYFIVAENDVLCSSAAIARLEIL